MPTQYLTRNRRTVHHSSCQKAGELQEPFSQEQSREDASSLRPRPLLQVTGLRASVGSWDSSPPDRQATSVSHFPADSNLETPSGPPREDSAQLCAGSGSREQRQAVDGAAWPSWVTRHSFTSQNIYSLPTVCQGETRLFLRHPAQDLECPRNGRLF